jgi:hypothetical protein
MIAAAAPPSILGGEYVVVVVDNDPGDVACAEAVVPITTAVPVLSDDGEVPSSGSGAAGATAALAAAVAVGPEFDDG